MDPKISVIVPVYKAEKYLHKCVDSILAQTFKDFEILLIDDGSPDASGAICDEYARKDNRVRVFHKENGGVSSARQCGIDNAKGEYTIHADPDDWVEPTMLEELYNKAVEENADMVICDYYNDYIKTGESKYIKQKPSSLDFQTVQKELFQQLHGSCCNKLIKRACYSNYNVQFPLVLDCCEDLYVCVKILSHNIKIAYLPKAFYHYSHGLNENSLVKSSISYSEETLNKDIQRKKIILNEIQEHQTYIMARNMFDYITVNKAFVSGVFSNKDFRQKMYPFRNSVLNYKNTGSLNRFCMYLSCCGFYKIIFRLYRTIKI